MRLSKDIDTTKTHAKLKKILNKKGFTIMQTMGTEPITFIYSRKGNVHQNLNAVFNLNPEGSKLPLSFDRFECTEVQPAEPGQDHPILVLCEIEIHST
jgi:hypothetical protein